MIFFRGYLNNFHLIHLQKSIIIKTASSFLIFIPSSIPPKMFFSGIDSQLGKSGDSFKNKSKIFINERFILKKIIDRCENYNLYEGIDLVDQKFVNIYVKTMLQQGSFSKQIKDQLRNKIAPPTIWTGTHKIQKFTYVIEVQDKFGPTLSQMFSHINTQISEKDFIHLFYQMIKLVQKIGSGGFVHRELSPSTIVFDPVPEKNDLYALNTFSLKKKNQECPKLSTKHCSKGSHLGLNANIKDDLQSICYIMLDIYSSGKFMKTQTPSQYENAKSTLEPKSICPNLPQIFLDFYYYVMGMNYTDEINYFHWKNLVLKTISKEWIMRPYSWMLGKKEQKTENQKEEEDLMEGMGLDLVEKIMHEEKENLDLKVAKFSIQSKTNSMKVKLKTDI